MRHVSITFTLALAFGCAAETAAPLAMVPDAGTVDAATPAAMPIAGGASMPMPLEAELWCFNDSPECTLETEPPQSLQCATILLEDRGQLAAGCIRAGGSGGGWILYVPSQGAAHSLRRGQPASVWLTGTYETRSCADPLAAMLPAGWCP